MLYWFKSWYGKYWGGMCIDRIERNDTQTILKGIAKDLHGSVCSRSFTSHTHLNFYQ